MGNNKIVYLHVFNGHGCLCANTCYGRTLCMAICGVGCISIQEVKCACVRMWMHLSVHEVLLVVVMCCCVIYSKLCCLLRFLSCHSVSMTSIHTNSHSHKNTQTYSIHTQTHKMGHCAILCLISHILLGSLRSTVCAVTSVDRAELGSFV